MNRRSFMQSVAAAFATPALSRFAPIEVHRDIDWSLFCCHPGYSLRYSIDKPFIQGGLRAATDCKILITSPDDSDIGASSLRFPNLSGLPWEEFATGGFRPLRKTLTTEKDYLDYECPVCFGRGRHGDIGRCLCYGEPTYDELGDGEGKCIFNSCSGTGWLGGTQCTACNGTGNAEYGIGIVDGTYFTESYLSMIRTIGDVDVKVFGDFRDSDRHPSRVLLFQRSDGARGFLMPLARD